MRRIKRNIRKTLKWVALLFVIVSFVTENNSVSTFIESLIPDEKFATSENATVITDVIKDSETRFNISIKYEDGSEFNVTDIYIPDYSGEAFVYVNDNSPYFTYDERKCTDAFEIYSQLDYLERCGSAFANLCTELMPTEERGDISSVYPSGWEQKKYEGLVDQDWLYNRCHLIAHSLAGENANERNLITGTRYMNIEGMWQFEETVLYYLKENPDNHVLYRVTPVFVGNELVARGVLMEAYSIEDNGTGVCFNVYCYNVTPGIVIDYATGDSWAEE